MSENTQTVDDYIASLPPERRQIVESIRGVFKKAGPRQLSEALLGNMIGYGVPHSVYPPGYHCNPKQPLQYAALANQKNYVAMYLPVVYCDAELLATFKEEWEKDGHKLDMGKSCVRIKKGSDLNLVALESLLAQATVDRFIAKYEEGLTSRS